MSLRHFHRIAPVMLAAACASIAGSADRARSAAPDSVRVPAVPVAGAKAPKAAPAPAVATPDTAEVHLIVDVDVRPVVMNAPEVMSVMERNFPAELQAAGVGAVIHLLFVVERDGSTSEIRVSETSDARFSAAAIETGTMMRFSPGTIRGVPVRVLVIQPLTYAPAPAGDDAN